MYSLLIFFLGTNMFKVNCSKQININKRNNNEKFEYANNILLMIKIKSIHSKLNPLWKNSTSPFF